MILPAKGFLEKPNNFFAIKDFMVIPPFFLLFKTHSTIPASFKLLYQNSNTKLIHFYKKCFIYIGLKGGVKIVRI
jgi:hypothetical protein